MIYFVVQMLLLFFVTLACWLKPDQLLKMPDQWLWIPLLLSFFGIMKILFGLVTLGRYLYPLPAVQPNSPLIRHGAFAKVRHPIYGGFMLLAISAAAYTGSLTAMAISFALCIWLALKARYEERFLLQKFPDYAEYQQNSRAFF